MVDVKIFDFLVIMIGASVLLIVLALLVYWRRSRKRAMLTDPHRDRLYHYSRPEITDVPVDCYSRPHHHRHRHSEPAEK